MQNATHSISIENTKQLTATAIEGVRDFSPSQFTLLYQGGKIVVSGSDMKITSFSKETGGFSATGSFSSVRYISAGEGLRKKIFR